MTLTPLPDRPTADDVLRARAELFAARVAAPALHRLLDEIEHWRPILERTELLLRRIKARRVHGAYRHRHRRRW